MVSNELNRWRLLVATYNTIKRQFYGMEHTVEGSLSLKYMESGIFLNWEHVPAEAVLYSLHIQYVWWLFRSL